MHLTPKTPRLQALRLVTDQYPVVLRAVTQPVGMPGLLGDHFTRQLRVSLTSCHS